MRVVERRGTSERLRMESAPGRAFVWRNDLIGSPMAVSVTLRDDTNSGVDGKGSRDLHCLLLRKHGSIP